MAAGLTLCSSSRGVPGILVRRRGTASKGNCVASILSFRTFANSAGVPVVVFVDMQQEYLTKPRSLAVSKRDHAPDKCRRVLDHARKIASPLAFIPSCSSFEPFTAMMNQSRGGFAGESTCPSTSIDAFHRRHEVAFLCDASASHALDDVAADDLHCAISKISGLYGEVYETTDWIASTLPRKLGNGKNAGG
jgi:hypothetical protein